jgi:hypothetical protein
MCSNATVVHLWFLSAGWERTKRGIPSRWFQLKSNGIVIVCWLTIAKRTHLSPQILEERGREVKTSTLAWERGRWRRPGMRWCAIGVDRLMAREVDWRGVRQRWGVRVINGCDGQWAVGRWVDEQRAKEGRQARKRERPRHVNSCFFKLNFNLFSENLD